MAYLNLISANQKTRIEKERLFLVSHNIIGIILITISIASIMLIIARFILIEHFNKIRNDNSLVNVEHMVLQSNIDRLNNQVEDVAKVQESFLKWSLFLADFSAIADSSTVLNFAHFSREAGTFRITGTADSRESLLFFEQGLKDIKSLNLTDAPLSNLLERENIDFRFGGKIEPRVYMK